jgi:peptidoglycan/LPS O-acetylase OafA/YrhL
MSLKSIETIQSGNRISSVDVFRGFAILPVVAYHFNGTLPYGYLGVDLFFVISGLLVGSILIKKFKKNEKINFFKFFLQRGFKIWPSYYWFLVLGALLAFLMYKNDRPEFYFDASVKDVAPYALFYQNYSSVRSHWPFDHVWSLCVEEHFYILLPLMLIVVKAIFSNKKFWLFFSVTGLILAGILLKVWSIYFTNSKETYGGTHTRIDALGWGVLLGVLLTYYEEYIRRIKWLKVLFAIGLVLFAINIFILIKWHGYFFEKVVFHSVTPFCFFLMLLGLYYHDFSKWKIIRFVAYYSYNWYLWHPIFAFFIAKQLGTGAGGFITYMLISFGTAFLFTILIEEKFLKMRERVINKLFK